MIPHMRLITKLDLLFVLLLTTSAVALSVSWWSARSLRLHVERIDLAHQSLESHLSLSNHTYQLFKQYGDALIISDQDNGLGERALIAAIREDIQRIRLLIGREIELVGEEEIEELDALSEIERTIRTLISEIEVLLNNGAPEEFADYWQRLSEILDNDIDRDFHAQITAAIEEERGEVRETEQQVEREILMLRWVTILCGLLALLTVLAAMGILRHQVRNPLRKLLEGVRGFGDGDLARRINISRSDEIGEIGATFDEMAERIASSTADMERQNSDLGGAVQERTARLETLLEDVRHKEAQRRRLLADVSHELRTPLTIIQGEADIALRGGNKEPGLYREALERSRDAARHTARLVDDLLFIARHEEGAPKLRLTEFDLRTLIEDTTPSVCADAIIDITPAAMPIHGDQDRIRQAILVLLENARRHGGEQVWVRAVSAIQGWRISVEDNGAGLSDEDKESVFERFYQGSDAATRYSAGSGLGLPIVRSIAEAHHGSVLLSDRKGGGLVASLFLPHKAQLRVVG